MLNDLRSKFSRKIKENFKLKCQLIFSEITKFNNLKV